MDSAQLKGKYVVYDHRLKRLATRQTFSCLLAAHTCAAKLDHTTKSVGRHLVAAAPLFASDLIDSNQLDLFCDAAQARQRNATVK